jgi:hypothetical protein
MTMSAQIRIHVGGRIIPNVATLKATPRSRSGGGSERRSTATDARMSRSCRTQQDLGGLENEGIVPLSSSNRRDGIHGLW